MKNGKYIINYTGSLNWNDSSCFICWIFINGIKVSGNTYSNKPLIYSQNGYINATYTTELKKDDNIVIKIYQYGNGRAGTNNLEKNDLKLVKIGN